MEHNPEPVLLTCAYEIVSELGYGGMGAVYLARRADGKFEQTVAVKMLRREFNTERLRRTFARETNGSRRSLASALPSSQSRRI